MTRNLVTCDEFKNSVEYLPEVSRGSEENMWTLEITTGGSRKLHNEELQNIPIISATGSFSRRTVLYGIGKLRSQGPFQI
jgi:hypothetical protein